MSLTTNESRQRLERLITKNLTDDLVLQGLVLLLIVIWLPKPWMLAVWVSRWVVVIGIWIARRSVKKNKASLAVLQLTAGHCVGVIVGIFILPPFAAVTMLVVVGDLLLVPFVNEGIRKRFVGGLLFVAAVGSLASLQNWTGLAPSAPRALVIVALIIHTFATGATISRSHRENYVLLTTSDSFLRVLKQRLAGAVEQERKAVTEAIYSGPIADLDRLAVVAQSINDRLVAEPDWANTSTNHSATFVQESLRSLRTLSHGIFPEALSQHGLGAAVTILLSKVERLGPLNIIDSRFDQQIESALYVCISDLARIAKLTSGTLSFAVTGGLETVELSASITDGQISNDPASSDRTVSRATHDRIGAVGGDLSFTSSGSEFTFAAVIPTSNVSDAESGKVNLQTRAVSNERILQSFVRSSLIAAILGLFVALAIWVFTMAPVAGLVSIVMACVLIILLLARKFLTDGRFGSCVVALCVETCAAGVFVTLIEPRIAPVTGLITTLPLVLALPHFKHRSLDLIAAIQTLALTTVGILAFRNDPLTTAQLSLHLLVPIVPICAAGVAFLVASTILTTTHETVLASEAVRVSLLNIVSDADKERQAIEHDLHDGAQQQFVALSMQLRTLAKLIETKPEHAKYLSDSIVRQVGETREDLVALANGSSLPALAEGRLVEALQIAALRTQQHVTVTSNQVDRVPPEVAKAVYLSCHEALQNAGKHAGPDAVVTIDLNYTEGIGAEPGRLSFSVKDDGEGFDVSTKPAGQGLTSLKDRLASLGGTLIVTSTVGTGTTVSGTVPALAPQVDCQV